jgi:hypothetical protein
MEGEKEEDQDYEKEADGVLTGRNKPLVFALFSPQPIFPHAL